QSGPEHGSAAMRGAERGEDALDRVALGDGIERIGLTSVVQPADGKLRTSMPSNSPSLVVAGADQKAPQPGLEATAVTQPWEIPPGADHRLLHSVLGSALVAQDPDRRGEAPIELLGGNLLEGDSVAATSCFDQTAQHAAA